MKRFSVFCYLCSVICLLPLCGNAQNYCNASAPDKMWGYYCYREMPVEGVTIDPNVYRESDTKWYDARTNETTMSTMPSMGMIIAYHYRIPSGHVKADVVWKNKYAKYAKVDVRVVHPHSGQVLYNGSFGNTDIAAQERTDVLFPDINFPSDDFYRIELRCDDWSRLQSINYFNYYRESDLPVLIPRNFGGTSAFMSPWHSSHPDAPEGDAYDWIYVEGRVNSDRNFPGTYYMMVGTPTGYMGMQTNYAVGNNDFVRSTLFSVWDAANMDEDPNLAEYLQSKVLDGHLDAVHTHAGGEGSSASVMFKDDPKWWRDDHWIQWLVNSRPMTTPVTVKGRNGQDSTFNYGYTVTSAWYKVDTMPEWRYLASIRAAGICRNFGGWYDFIEPFTSYAGQKMHTVYHRHPAMRSAASGKWYNCNVLQHGYDDNGDKDRRYHTDIGRGATSLYDNCFRMDMGGYVHWHDSAEVVPLAKDMSFVDTIQIDILNRRVNETLAYDDYYNLNERVNACARHVTAWRVLESQTSSPSSASNVLDGNKTTMWETSTYPAFLALQADEEQTFSGFELYWSNQYDSRAHFVDFFTSEDGENWTLAYDSLEVRCLDRIDVTLPHPIKTKYLRMRFHHKYTSSTRLRINELTMRGEFDLDGVKAVAKDLLDNAGTINNYPESDLQELKAVYESVMTDNGQWSMANGQSEKAQALATALQDVSRKPSFIRTYLVTNRINLAQEHAYFLQNVGGNGVLCATTDGQLTAKAATADGSLDRYKGKAPMDDPYCNWQVMHDEPYTAYYLYNIGAKKFLNTEAEGGLSHQPQALTLRPWGRGFYFAPEGATGNLVGVDSSTDALFTSESKVNDRCVFYFYDNFRMIQPVAVADSLRQYTETNDKVALYKAGVAEMLAAPIGVVGGFTSEEARANLQAAYDAVKDLDASDAQSSMLNAQFIDAVENADVIDFDPDNTVYRFASTAESLSATPYITVDADLRVYAKAASSGPEQIWRFTDRHDGYTLSSQGITLKPMGNRVGETITSTSNYANSGTFVLSEPAWGTHYIGATQFASAVVNGSNSPIKSAAPDAVGSTWYVEPAETATLSLNSVGVGSVYFDYAVIVPDDVKAYGVSGVKGDGTIELCEMGDTIPPRTGAILVGEKYQRLTLGVCGRGGQPSESNLLKGVFFRNTSLAKGTFMTLSTSSGEPVMKKPSIAVVSANQVYLPITADMPDLTTYTFDFDDPTAIKAVESDNAQCSMLNPQSTYDLHGRKINVQSSMFNGKLTKGHIYIRNHRKILLK
ncbi:MAG: discoidin domain-containing protein [Bacteroidaceae bacterium]|nr:discoidin domain-containing protein [Bacteroidaceae bacterium]